MSPSNNSARLQRHCRLCGGLTEAQIPAGDNRVRDVCSQCGEIHYCNPLNVVGTLPWRRNSAGEVEVLMCLRNIDPQKGWWTLPAGFMELNETLAQGAQRETHEEAGANIEMGPLFFMCSVHPAQQVHFFYLAHLLSDVFDPGHETQRVSLFTQKNLPWSEVAFESVKQALQVFFQQIDTGQFSLESTEIQAHVSLNPASST